MNTVKEIREGIVRSLTPHVGKDEAEAMARIILEDAAGMSRTAAIIDPGRLLEDATVARISAIVGRVADGEPLQYVLGEAVFMGMRLRVTPYTLIPRPETAGLVDIITDAHLGHKDLQVIDIGTGSGCIAIALARALPYCAVTAADISSEALAVASYNASALGTSNVKCIRLDALHLPMPAPRRRIWTDACWTTNRARLYLSPMMTRCAFIAPSPFMRNQRYAPAVRCILKSIPCMPPIWNRCCALSPLKTWTSVVITGVKNVMPYAFVPKNSHFGKSSGTPRGAVCPRRALRKRIAHKTADMANRLRRCRRRHRQSAATSFF